MTQDTPPPAEGRAASSASVKDAVGRSALMGAVFLMATSAIGPGFLTQTAQFTAQLGAAFACAILVSILIDIAIQLNVWRVIGVSGRRAHELGNAVLPGVGHLLSGLVAIGIFLSHRAGVALDRIVVVLGVVMILATLAIAITSQPPVVDALVSTVAPDTFDFVATTTIIGGTVGGYITYAGAHRLIDSGRTGPEHVRDITRTSVVSILITGLMRVLLFLAILGVVAGGVTLAADDPAGSAFRAAAGEAGLRVFGVILWAAALTSVIGAAYTSVSFLTRTTTPARTRNLLTIAFIVLSAGTFVVIEQAPATLLVFAGTFNGLILPIGFTVLLWVAWRRRDLLGGYAYPRWLLVLGVVAWLLTLYLGYNAILGLAKLGG
ncbi:divalent metal cation transporter [Alteromonas gracilis]